MRDITLLIISVLLSVLSILLLFLGFIIEDVIEFTEWNWRFIFIARLMLHFFGLLCIGVIFYYFRVYIKATIVVSISILIMINALPILAIFSGIQQIQDYQTYTTRKSESRSSSKYNSSSFTFEYTGIKSNKESIEIRNDHWQKIKSKCENRNPNIIKYIKYLNKVVSWKC